MEAVSRISLVPPHSVWYVAENEVRCREKTNEGIKNYIDLVQTILFVNDHIRNHHDELVILQSTSLNLLKWAFKASEHLEEQNPLCSLIVKVILYVFSGSTLNGAIDGLMETVFGELKLENNFSARALYPDLMKHARKALDSPEAYQKIAGKYTLPENFIPDFRNPILIYLNDALVEQWAKARELVIQGKNYDDWHLIYHCDRAMQIAKIMMDLAITQELELLGGDKAKNVTIQSYAIGRIHCQFTKLYLWLRSVPSYDPAHDRWQTAINRGMPDEVKPFYQPDTKQNAWREDYNAGMQLFERTIDVDKMLSIDERYMTGLDTKEILEPDYVPSPRQRHIAEAVLWDIDDDSIKKTRLRSF